jgi:lipopolysaccharide transport system permease protein
MTMLKGRMQKIFFYRHSLWNMAMAQVNTRYAGSIMGISWAVITPLLIMLIVSFVFTQVIKTEIKDFPLFILSALIPWFFFTNSITEATVSIKNSRDVLNQFIFVREIIPMAVVLANLINFLFGFIVVLPIFIISNAGIIRYFYLLPVIMFLYFVFTLGISLLFSIINVYLKDLAVLLNVGIMFLFWATPIFYPFETVPQNYRWIAFANPATSYIVIFRDLLYSASSGPKHMWLIASVFAAISIISGYALFIKKEKDILKYI